MTALELYKFLQENNIEHHWHGDVLGVFLTPFELKSFFDLCNPGLFADGIDAKIKEGYVWFDLVFVCDYYGIEPTEILKKD